MLKLATVFSGIGAIEHALDRMHVDHEIVFACDNGDVELEMPKVKVDIDAIETELKVLKKKVKAFNLDFADEESVDYAAQLDVMLVGVEGELKKLLERLEVSDDELKVINEALGDVDRILKSSMDATTASKKKKYKELLEIRNDSASDKAKLFFLLRVAVKVTHLICWLYCCSFCKITLRMVFIPIRKILLNAMVLVKYCGIRLSMKPSLCCQRTVRII